MNKFRQHIPDFIDIEDHAPEFIEFNTTEELLNIDVVKQWAKTIGEKKFSHFALSGNTLIAIYNEGHHWWVVGYILHPKMVQLPDWR